jgi:dTMP kinase
MRGTDERADYVHYQQVKVAASRRHRGLSALYGGVWFLDYLQEAFRRVTLPVLGRQLVVADRYIYDLVLNISLATARPVTSFSWLLKLFFVFNPRPDIVFLVDTPEEIAFARKADVHAIEYLRERRSEYLRLADRYGFHVLDGRADPDELLNEVLARCAGAARQPGQAAEDRLERSIG